MWLRTAHLPGRPSRLPFTTLRPGRPANRCTGGGDSTPTALQQHPTLSVSTHPGRWPTAPGASSRRDSRFSRSNLGPAMTGHASKRSERPPRMHASRVDANGDWTVDEAIEHCEWLANLDVEFVEQPVERDDIEGLGRVSRTSPIPVAADESCLNAGEVPRVADAVDIVVVKLMKCGGLRPAVRQIVTAQAHGLDVMLGCMVESYASLAAAWHIAPSSPMPTSTVHCCSARTPTSGCRSTRAGLTLRRSPLEPVSATRSYNPSNPCASTVSSTAWASSSASPSPPAGR